MRIRCVNSFFLAIALIICGFNPANAGTVNTLAFADSLRAEGDYYRAVTEYKRALFFLDTSSAGQKAKAIIGVGKSLYEGKQYLRAGTWILDKKQFLQKNGSNDEWQRLLFSAFIKSGRFGKVLSLVNAAEYPESEFYRGLVLANQTKWKEAESLFAGFTGHHVLYPQASFNASLCRSAVEAPRKNPAMSGFLGVIPGAGYLYSGYKRSALSSLIINGVFIYSTVRAFDEKQYALGGLLSFISFSWYLGNIYGSVNSARCANAATNLYYMERLIEPPLD